MATAKTSGNKMRAYTSKQRVWRLCVEMQKMIHSTRFVPSIIYIYMNGSRLTIKSLPTFYLQTVLSSLLSVKIAWCNQKTWNYGNSLALICIKESLALIVLLSAIMQMGIAFFRKILTEKIVPLASDDGTHCEFSLYKVTNSGAV